MLVLTLFLYPRWTISLWFAVFGLFFLLLTLWKNGGEKKPWEYKLVKFRWLLLPLMVSVFFNMIISLIPLPAEPPLAATAIVLLFIEYIFCFPSFLFGLSFLVSVCTKKLWKRLLPVIFVAAADFVLLLIFMFTPRKSYFVDNQAVAQAIAIFFLLPVIVCNLVFMFIGFFQGRRWAEKSEKKEPQVLEEAV